MTSNDVLAVHANIIFCPKCCGANTHAIVGTMVWKDGRNLDKRECACGTWWYHDNEHPDLNPRPSLDESGFYMTSMGDDDPNAHLFSRPAASSEMPIRSIRVGNSYRLTRLRLIDGGKDVSKK
jgi:hypothetical protein